MMNRTVCFALVAYCFICWTLTVKCNDESDGLDEWIVRITGGQRIARALAYELGYENVGQVRGFPDTYHLIRSSDRPEERKRGATHLTRRLAMDDRVLWAEQQSAKVRVKRPALDNWLFENQIKRDRNPGKFSKSSRPSRFNDELWDSQWYLQDTRTRSDLPKLDLHVLPVYDMNITGRGVRVTVLDDGLEWTHSDLTDNYDPESSYDVNEDDPDPMPRYDQLGTNSHGTRCAGEIAMIANNGKCGVGVAYNSKIGGIRMLDGKVSDRVEGVALAYGHDKIDVYSSSWGPNDDGKTVEGPGRLAREALLNGVTKGRGGKGVIFVWASGNGGVRRDNCNCDGYTSSIYTLSIGSASEQGMFPWYGEMCASTVAVTYSSGAYQDQKISTTDLLDKCTTKHTGTSAAAPLAAGIVALALEANPALTWRDMQHLVVWTSEESPLRNNPGWTENGAGLRVNLRFGFGLINAYGLVKKAMEWKNVPEQHVCLVLPQIEEDISFGYGNPFSLDISTEACKGTDQEINYLEHVELITNIEYPVRGAIEILLTSPSGTQVQLLTVRPNDQSDKGFSDWKFMSVHTWGENPSGVWRAEVRDRVTGKSTNGSIGQFSLIMYGTQEMPAHMENGPRIYQEDYNSIRSKKIDSVSDESMTLEDLLKQHDDISSQLFGTN